MSEQRYHIVLDLVSPAVDNSNRLHDSDCRHGLEPSTDFWGTLPDCPALGSQAIGQSPSVQLRSQSRDSHSSSSLASDSVEFDLFTTREKEAEESEATRDDIGEASNRNNIFRNLEPRELHRLRREAVQEKRRIRRLKALSKDYRCRFLHCCWGDCSSASMYEDVRPESMSATSSHGIQKGKGIWDKTTPVAAFENIDSNFRIGQTQAQLGVVRLFKDAEHAASVSSPQAAKAKSHNLALDELVTVAILAVPSYMTTADFLAFVRPAVDAISHFRLVREAVSEMDPPRGNSERHEGVANDLAQLSISEPTRCDQSAPHDMSYMALLRFRQHRDADEFFKLYNGREFTAVGSETCHVVWVGSITIHTTDEEGPVVSDCEGPAETSASKDLSHARAINGTQYLEQDPLLPGGGIGVPDFRPTHAAEPTESAYRGSTSDDNKDLHPDTELTTARPDRPSAVLPPPEQYELPTCPVCLERMDSSVTGLLTILCQHTFHCHCLERWGGGRCPVCRYSQTRRLPAHRRHGSVDASGIELDGDLHGETEGQITACAVCSALDNLWICVICGHVGCGRYDEAHAHAHYLSTSHLYAMEIETGRVWDYAGDGYVHRLIQNKSDGKVVELPQANATSDGLLLEKSRTSVVDAEKLESVGMEYTYLLTSQLESQRLFYEERLKDATIEVKRARAETEKLRMRSTMRQEEEESLLTKGEAMQLDLVRLAQEKSTALVRASKASELARTLKSQLENERSLSAGLMDRIRALQGQAEADARRHRAEVIDLEEQVKDLMANFDMMDRLRGMGEMGKAAEGASIGLIPAVPAAAPATKGPRRSRGRR